MFLQRSRRRLYTRRALKAGRTRHDCPTWRAAGCGDDSAQSTGNDYGKASNNTLFTHSASASAPQFMGTCYVILSITHHCKWSLFLVFRSEVALLGYLAVYSLQHEMRARVVCMDSVAQGVHLGVLR